MASFLLAVKSGNRELVEEAGRHQEDLGNPFELAHVPEPGYAILRLTHLDAILVVRDSYEVDAPGLAEVAAWASRRLGPIATKSPIPECEVCRIAYNSEDLRECVSRLLFLVRNGKGNRRPDRTGVPPAGESQHLVPLFQKAIGAGWETPDQQINNKQDGIPARVERWILDRPVLARAAVADAWGWLAAKSSANSISSLAPLAKGTLSATAQRQFVVRTLARAVETLAAAEHRHIALGAGPQKRVVILWGGGDNRSFRNALMGLLFHEQIGEEQRPPAPAEAEPDYGFGDYIKQDRAPASVPSLDKLSPVVCSSNQDVDAVLKHTTGHLAAVLLPAADLPQASEAARALGFTPIIFKEDDALEPIEAAFANAESFSRISQAPAP